MAASQHIHFSATIRDEAGIKASKTSQLFIDPAQTVTQMVTAINAWLLALDAITGGQIVRASIGIPLGTLPAVKGAAVAGSEVQEVAVFNFPQTGLATHYGDDVPAFLETLEVNERPDLTNAAVQAYIALLDTPPVLGGGYSGLGNELLASPLYRAFLSTRKHRRAEFAKSVTSP